MKPMTDQPQPSAKLRNLRKQLFSIKDRRIIKDRLIEIEREAIQLENENAGLRQKNFDLVCAVTPDVEVPF